MREHFLVIGAQRCGTTWLHDLLAEHPQIAMARPARPEPKAFLRLQPPVLSEYRREFFAHAREGQIMGEKSTSYLESPGTPDRVAGTLGRPRIVVQLRDPVQRAVSNWGFSRDHGVEKRPLAEALRTDLVRPRGWDPQRWSVSPFAYVSRGRYIEDLEPWLDRFEVYVSFLEDLQAEPDRVGELYEWLGVDRRFRPDPRDGRTNASASSLTQPSPALVAQLREHYAAADNALAERLGRDLPWPAERVA